MSKVTYPGYQVNQGSHDANDLPSIYCIWKELHNHNVRFIQNKDNGGQDVEC